MSELTKNTFFNMNQYLINNLKRLTEGSRIIFFARVLLIFFLSLVLSACSPHPGSGVWKTTADNKMGISKLIVSFDGRAEFVSKKQDNTVWHCFWGKVSAKELNFECTPSTNPDQKKMFILRVNKQGLANLYHESTLIATLKRLDENPSIIK